MDVVFFIIKWVAILGALFLSVVVVLIAREARKQLGPEAGTLIKKAIQSRLDDKSRF